MKRMFRRLPIPLVPSALLCMLIGCYTYELVTTDGLVSGFPRSELSARIILYDGSFIDTPEYAHVLITSPSSLVAGVGHERTTRARFNGVIFRTDLDSTRLVETSSGAALLCWLKNRTSLAFRPGEYLMVGQEDEPGFWCAGQRTEADRTEPFRGKITRDQIAKIKTREFDYTSTAYLVLPVVAFVIVVEAVRGSVPSLRF